MFTLEESALLGRMLRAMAVMAFCAIAGVGYLVLRMHPVSAPSAVSAPVAVSAPAAVSTPPAVSAPLADSAHPAVSAPPAVAGQPAAAPASPALESVRHADGQAAAPVAKPHKAVHRHHLRLTRARHHQA